MAGGAGVEWYFGYQYPHNDLNLEDWRSRDSFWDQTRFALEFFQQHLPFTEMSSMDELTAQPANYVFARTGTAYAVYLPTNQPVDLDLTGGEGSFALRWYNPRSGVFEGESFSLTGGQSVTLTPPNGAGDWVALVENL
jgi:hypothetical protein